MGDSPTCQCEWFAELEADSLSWASDADCFPSGVDLRGALARRDNRPHPDCRAAEHDYSKEAQKAARERMDRL